MKKYVNTLLCLGFCLLSSILLDASSFVVPKRWNWPQIPLDTQQRPGSYPFICGDTFRKISDFIIDETQIPFDPSRVNIGDVIFVGGNYLDFFVKEIHGLISSPYILITHNSLQVAPGKYLDVLNDPKVIAWFGKNISIVNHPKLFPLPLGVPNRHWPWGDIDVLQNVMAQAKNVEKKHLLYLNFDTKTNGARKQVETLFSEKSFCYKATKKPYKEYLEDLMQSKFVLSPIGAGTDCHRTWEALLVGSIPIITHSTLDGMFEDLPVLFVDRWEEVTEEFLIKKYYEMAQKTYHLEKLYADYWITQIQQIKISSKKQNKVTHDL